MALLLPAVQAGREAARRAQCTNNLKQIGLGMHNYHGLYKCFPPAVITDENGRPMRSWRVAILPYIEQQGGLYDKYDCNVAWDDPNNGHLMGIPIMAYRCPSDPPSSDPARACDTNYVMIVGEGTVGGKPNKAVTIAKIRDGTSNTIMAIELGASTIHWMEPRDLTIEEAVTFITNPAASQFQQPHTGGVNVLMADAKVHFIANSIDPKLLRDLLTRNDGQAVGDF